ncbi:myrosinase 1-like [Helicoverpa zea]|uniref:myrosinase 1-like n=1 Tax=Helicoverpa zea TaxID=7113 RepID=UPI001F5717E2|nr:myrosinase 1-like [Helicoverpa zea]
MQLISAVVFSAVVSGCFGQNETFPTWFLFGAATAAYQIEGGWNAGDKGESMWDRLLHSTNDITLDSSNADVACDSYHLWKRDIEVAKELGLNVYRFSISWPRILPSGFPNQVSEDGKKYYSNLIDGLLEKGIQPVVTMYHWDLPQSLQDLGGWANPLIATWFGDYARVLYNLFGDRVKYWITLNEPLAICDGGYNKMAAPYLDDMKIGGYLCNKHVLLAHAAAYRVYEKEFQSLYYGKLSMANVFFWFKPEKTTDEEATKLAIQMWEGRYAHPIYSESGGWPPELEKILAENSKKEGYPYPRLPPFTPEEIEFVKGTYDFYALNHYTTRLVRKVDPEKAGSWPYYGCKEIGVDFVNHPTWKTAVIDWFAIYPEGLREQLLWINNTYGVDQVMITENGYPDLNDDLFDVQRMTYIKTMLQQVFLAINDGIHVMGYTVWSMMDNFEWVTGYKTKYGLYAVDFLSPNLTRTPRESARFYSSVTKGRRIPKYRVLVDYEDV